MNTDKHIPTAEVTDAVIAKWKKEHGDNIQCLVVGDKKAWFKRPDRPTVSYALTLMGTDPLGAYGAILGDSFLGGDRQILDDDKYFYVASPFANKLLGEMTAELVKV